MALPLVFAVSVIRRCSIPAIYHTLTTDEIDNLAQDLGIETYCSNIHNLVFNFDRQYHNDNKRLELFLRLDADAWVHEMMARGARVL